MDVRLYYPPSTDERYPQAVEEAGKKFTWLLFEPRRLGEAAFPTFEEFLEDKGKTCANLEELIEYRLRFGNPILDRVNMFAVPPSRATRRLDSPGERYTFDTIFELIFRIPYHSLMPEWREGLAEDVEVPITLRMWEPYQIDEVRPGDQVPATVPVGSLLVRRRSYWPILVRRMGKPYDQISHVGDQVRYYAKNGTAMAATSPLWLPTWRVYNNLMRDSFPSDPTVAGN